VGGLAAEVMDSAVDVRVLAGEKARHRVDHTLRFLRGGSVVEVDEGFAINLPGEDGEIGADGYGIKGSHGMSIRCKFGGKPFLARVRWNVTDYRYFYGDPSRSGKRMLFRGRCGVIHRASI